ncbi:sensor histidine kinase [Candidatus Moduliflexota bacterium]
MSCDDAEVTTSVSAEGPGIPAEELDTLFTYFSKISVRLTGGERSTGLGLAIAKRIVEGHGGRIRVKSGEGIGFCLHPAVGAASPRKEGASRLPPGTSETWGS